MIPPPPPLSDLRAGTVLVAGAGHSTVLADFDFETYSEAGFVWNETAGRWEAPEGTSNQSAGLRATAACVYTEHPTCEVLSLAYDLKDGRGKRRWKPGDPNPDDLFRHVVNGGLLEAHNSGFEFWVWKNVCVPRYGFPPIVLRQLRCSMAKGRAHALPGALDDLSEVLALTHRKDKDGRRLLAKFSRPQNPTKKDPRKRIRPADDPADAAKLYAYNERDIEAESEASSLIPDLDPTELEFWFTDQEVNTRGVAVDSENVENCIAIVEEAFARYTPELFTLTEGRVQSSSQAQRIQAELARYGMHLSSFEEMTFERQLNARGVFLKSVKDDAVKEFLKLPGHHPTAKRILELRYALANASVKKLYSIRNQTSRAGRLHDLFSFHAARTGRATGNGPQPQNLYKGGPDLFRCEQCAHWFGANAPGGAPVTVCPWCAVPLIPGQKKHEWTVEAADDAFTVIACRSLDLVEMFFGDALELVSGCVRFLFVAAPGYEFIASDFSAIEAVVLANMAGEQWRLDVFATHGKIYETTASKVIGIPLDEMLRVKAETGSHHPARQSVGKCLELACGYGGWINATKAANIRMDRFFSDELIRKHIIQWRKDSPQVERLWGGQHTEPPWSPTYHESKKYFGLEGAAIQAVLRPGYEFTYRHMSYFMRGDALYCRLPSGRLLTYHRPRLHTSTRREDELELSFEGWNTNPNNGPIGWIRMKTYGGKLTENNDQAISRDILRDAVIRLRGAGYPTVLHVHDEIVTEVPIGFGSIVEVETLMMVKPAWWPEDWPWVLKAAGGWRGRRYRKD